MKNPFDEKNEVEKFSFFQQMTSAINDWMLEKYPDFDSRLLANLKKVQENQEFFDAYIRTKSDAFENEINKYKKIIENSRDQLLDYIKKEINEFMLKDHPGMISQLNTLKYNLETYEKQIKKQIKDLEKCNVSFTKSSSLIEDIYFTKDKVSNMEKSFEKFKNNTKKILSDL